MCPPRRATGWMWTDLCLVSSGRCRGANSYLGFGQGHGPADLESAGEQDNEALTGELCGSGALILR